MGLEIAFVSIELRKTCESPARARRELGNAASTALRRCLADLRAVETVDEFLKMGLGLENRDQESKNLQFPLSDGLCLCCKANHHEIPMSGKRVDWTKVTRLKVVSIESCQ